MIRIVGREIVRERSYAFPTDSPMPRVGRALPQRLRREPAGFVEGAEDLIVLRYNLQSRVASIHTCNSEVAWTAEAPCRLQIDYRPDSSLSPGLNVQPAGQAALAATRPFPAGAHPNSLAASDGWSSGDGANGPNGKQAGRQPAEEAAVLPARQEGRADAFLDNGDPRAPFGPARADATFSALGEGGSLGRIQHPHRPPSSRGAYPPTVEDVGKNGDGRQAGYGYVALGLLEPGCAQPHIVLRSDTCSLALLGRYRLWAETLAKWTERTTAVVQSSGRSSVVNGR